MLVSAKGIGLCADCAPKEPPLTLFVAMFGLGLVTSVHCVAMCGPLVLTYAVRCDDESLGIGRRMLPHLAYQSAKVLSYVAIGAILGAIGSVLNLGPIRGWVAVGAGVFMVLLGLAMTGLFPSLKRLQLRPPKALQKALVRTRRQAQGEVSRQGHVSVATPITFGLLTGLMPCAPLQGAQLTAAATGSALTGATTMLAFGLGTVPLMLGFGTVSGYLGAKVKRRMYAIGAIVIIVMGLIVLDRGATLVGSPVTSQTLLAQYTGTSAPPAAFKTGPDGVVEIPVAIVDTQYVPNVLKLPADRPVRLLVDRKESVACSNQIAVPQLGVLADLKPDAVTKVDIPPARAGSYTLTCGMGMMQGRLDVGAAGVTAGPNWLLIAATLAAIAALGWFFWWRFRRVAPAAGASPEQPGPADDASPPTCEGSEDRA
jgi:sulfite exporter TauE/SafE